MDRLRINNLVVEYRSGGGYIVRAIDGLSTIANSGELVLLLGPSGCGKTTLLSCLAGILTPTAGLIEAGDTVISQLDGRRLSDYRRYTVGIVFQAFNLVPSLTALQNVAAPLWSAGVPARRAHERAEELLARVDLADRAGHHPGDLSGGQQQRVAIARALVHDPPLLLADEPTAHLDYIQVEIVLKILRELAAPGRIVIVATHDERIVPLADRIVDLAPKGRLVARRPQRVQLMPGQVLFRQGARGELIFFVERGEIEIVRELANGREKIVETVGPGDYFGELAPLLGFPRTATARARNQSTVVGYTVDDLRGRIGHDRFIELLRTSRQPVRIPSTVRDLPSAPPGPAETQAAPTRADGPPHARLAGEHGEVDAAPARYQWHTGDAILSVAEPDALSAPSPSVAEPGGWLTFSLSHGTAPSRIVLDRLAADDAQTSHRSELISAAPTITVDFGPGQHWLWITAEWDQSWAQYVFLVDVQPAGEDMSPGQYVERSEYFFSS